ncbi:hypothetical protein [Endozoicomonas numazuensis]|uniref:Uncharacterized protein n=1 Tax=Endozoicomonas numazuensis TaxID=1137799 RepID=A0A081N0Z5_9GAMM|nr:hypothetical protein [Endozoicomonas numazuensis]KEQ12118.1 hypothetical protein GZ78_28190 [Endozoicomonas numazuensis]
MKKSLFFGLFICFVPYSLALPVNTEGSPPVKDVSDCKTHFNYTVKSSSGEWQTYVHFAAEDGTSVLPEKNCEKVAWFEKDDDDPMKVRQIQLPLVVSEGDSEILGYQLGTKSDFYGVLSITMVQMPTEGSRLREHYKLYELLVDKAYSLKKAESTPPPAMCSFVIAASGPGKPVVTPFSFHGAVCNIDPNTLSINASLKGIDQMVGIPGF